MATNRKSPLQPGAYGKAQRWHEILTHGSEARARKSEQARRANEEAANNASLGIAAAITALLTPHN